MLSDSEVEDQLLGLMNDERAASGLPPCVQDGALDPGRTRAHRSADVEDRGGRGPERARVVLRDRRPCRNLDRVLEPYDGIASDTQRDVWFIVDFAKA
jgi:hypothetical protein